VAHELSHLSYRAANPPDRRPSPATLRADARAVANPEHLAGAGSDHLDAPDAVSGAHLGRDLDRKDVVGMDR
jgi:hypothetical protein